MNYWNEDRTDNFLDLLPTEKKTEKSENPQHFFSSVPKHESQFEILVHNSRITLKNNNPVSFPHIVPQRKVNDISGFTANSRRRLISIFSRIEFNRYSHPMFLTTTFHNVYPQNERDLKRLLELFIKRAKRKNKNFHYVWKLELQKRGAPHFHFLILPLFFMTYAERLIFQNNFISAWHKYIKDFSHAAFLYSAKFVDFQKVSKIKRYLLKYLEKIDSEKYTWNLGRIWGRSKDLYMNAIFHTELNYENFKLIKCILYDYCESKFKMSEEMKINFLSQSTISVCIDFQELFKYFRENLFEHYPNFYIDKIQEFFCSREYAVFLTA